MTRLRTAVDRYPLAVLALGLLLVPWLLGAWVGPVTWALVAVAALGCWSYYLLWGQGGMLSFGHAVYSGMGAYGAVWALRALADSPWQGSAWATLAVALTPLAGALVAAAVAAPLGALVVRRPGMALAMISLALGELVFALALMFPAWSGGEAGLSANRVLGAPVLGITWADKWQVYGLAAATLWLGVALLRGWMASGAGALLRAVRDNPQRVAALGHNPVRVRWAAHTLAAALAGAAGAVGALVFELVSPEALGAQRSGAWMLFTVLGGAQHFWGPLLGGVLMVGAQVGLSGITPAWALYVGLLFVLVLLAAPGGVAGVLAGGLQAPSVRCGRWCLGLALAAGGGVVLVEMLYHWQARAWLGHGLTLLGQPWATDVAWHWALPALACAAGLALLWAQRRAHRGQGA